jgi:hypothetical protein
MPTSLVFADCHNDLLLGVSFQRDLGKDELFGEFWLPQLRAGKVRLVVLRPNACCSLGRSASGGLYGRVLRARSTHGSGQARPNS